MLRIALTTTFLFTLSLAASYSQDKGDRPDVIVTQKAMDIHKEGFVFDGHNDLPWAIRTNGSSSFKKIDIAQPQPKLHTDIARLKKGNVGAQFWSVYVPASTMKKGTALTDTVQ